MNVPRQEQRRSFLIELYRRTDNGDRLSRQGRYQDVGDALGLTPDEAERLALELMDAGWAEFPVMGEMVVTPEGRRKVEEWLAPEAAVIQAVITVEQQREIEVVLKDLRNAVEEEGPSLAPDDEADLRAQLETVDAQLRSPRPRRDILAMAFGILRDVAVQAVGAASGQALVHVATRAAGLLG